MHDPPVTRTEEQKSHDCENFLRFASSALLADSAYAAANGSLNLPQVQTMAVAEASVRTETKKKVFLIRVNFTDRPEEPVTKASVEPVMVDAGEMIRRISYGRNWVKNAANTNVYTMAKDAHRDTTRLITPIIYP